MKKISIITVVKNGLPYLKSAVQAIKDQNIYNNNEIEHIIVCSPSKDGTEEYLSNIENIKLIIDKDSHNKFGSLNLGLNNCNADIVGILHSDDVFYDYDTLEKILLQFDENTDVVFGNILFSDKNDLTKIKRKWVSTSYSSLKLSLGWMPPHTSIFARKEILKKNLYETQFPISGDYHFILKLFNNKNIKAKYINEIITIMRTGGDSTKISNFFKKLDEDIKIIKKFYKFYIITLTLKILSKLNQFKIKKFELTHNYIKKLNEIK